MSSCIAVTAGTVGVKLLALGNTALMTQLNVSVDALKAQAEALRATGASVMFLAVNGQSAGLLAVSDPIILLLPLPGEGGDGGTHDASTVSALAPTPDPPPAGGGS